MEKIIFFIFTEVSFLLFFPHFKPVSCILEFIQTEMHHVRTLKVLLQVYMYELRRSQLIEDAKLEQLFLSVEELLSLHQHFLSCLKARQEEAQPEESPNNYQITQFGDILVSQVDMQDISDGHTLLCIGSSVFILQCCHS